MRLNHKQQELIEQFSKEIEEKFPDVKFVNVSPSPESEETLWLQFTKPDNDDRMLDIIEYASNRTMDILLDYGYHMLIMPVAFDGVAAATARV